MVGISGADPKRMEEWKKHVLKVPVFARGGTGSARKRGEIPNRPLKQSQVWEKLRDAFRLLYPAGHILRVENGTGSRGMPDVYYRITRGLSGFVEIKTGYQKPTDLQKEWHKRERAAGGMVWVLTIRPECALLDAGTGPLNLGIATWMKIVEKI